ncbi:MAG: NPXTG-anchored protein, partial [Ruminococcus sp.]|uniref:SpaA isopeptide-forming pilin-related protein n=1 Tax=Ruminococcus sp. TaxID=41978 RepID=UPI0025E0A05A
TVNDAQKTTKVTITKTDIAGTAEITGAVLTIKDSTGKTVTGTPWTSGKDGKVLELELKNGTYTLTETGDNIVDENGNEYDVIDSTLTFKVENGKVTSVKNSTNKNSGEGFYDVDSTSNTITVNDAQKTTKVTITKTDIAGTAEITGAVLTVKDSTGKTVTGTPWTSGKDGKVLELELKNGTYTLTETGDNIVDENGNEYDVIDSTLTFEVKDGKVTSVKNDTSKNSGEGFYDVDSTSNTITVNDAQKTTKVTITKTDIAGTAEITGAVLTIKDSTGKTVTGTPWTSGKDGKVLELELKNGTYTLTETGDNIVDENGNEYDVIDSTLTFKVENGKVTEVTNETSKDNGEGFFNVDNNTITVNDAKKSAITTTKVTITKTDITGEAEITGAVLTVTDSDDNIVTGTPWTSGIDGEKLELELENGTYTLTETEGNNKIVDENGNEYEVIDSSLTFKVEEGKVTVVSNDTENNSKDGFYSVDSENNIITVSDAMRITTAKVTITKTDITGAAEIAGAVLTIKDSDGNIVTGTPWTSGVDGKKLEIELANGTYTLTETGDNITDAEGNEYEVIESSLTFEVKDGKVKVVENNTDADSGEGFFSVDVGSNTITVNDAKKTVDDSSSKPETDDDSSKPEVEGPEDSSEDESQGDSSSEEDSSSDSSSSESSSSADSSSSSTADSSSSSTATSTSTNTNTDNPNTGARVLINAAEFAAAVGLCFLAIRRKKKDDDQ